MNAETTGFSDMRPYIGSRMRRCFMCMLLLLCLCVLSIYG